MNTIIQKTIPSKDYELIDSGDGEKLERFVEVVLRRPDPQAFWSKSLDVEKWKEADGYYFGEGKSAKWIFANKNLEQDWQIKIEDIVFNLKLQKFKHLGIFPEQQPNWNWITETIKKSKGKIETPMILNLFAYTGGATVAALKAGASVTHVDASSGSVDWAKENIISNGLENSSIRYMVDDARKFVEREIRRGVRYHGVIMDPPAYGKGPKGEVWDIEKDFLPLIESVKKVLHSEPIFVLLNGYSAGYSSIAYAQNLISLTEKFGGKVESGELTIQDSGPHNNLLPAGIFARWSK